MKAITNEKQKSESGTMFTGKLGIPVKEGIFYCAFEDIVRIESEGSYSVFYITGGKRYVVTKGLKSYENLLPTKEFFRIHRSHLINIHKITRYVRSDGSFLEMEDGSLIEIARRKKDEFSRIMNAIS
jgi:two-component system LytT family response regulator